MSIRVRLGAGTGIELLMAAVAVADPDWRGVFRGGPTAYDAALAAGGRDLVRDTARFGRYGWINLAGPLTERPGAWSVAALRDWVARTDPGELRLVLTGARRHRAALAARRRHDRGRRHRRARRPDRVAARARRDAAPRHSVAAVRGARDDPADLSPRHRPDAPRVAAHTARPRPPSARGRRSRGAAGRGRARRRLPAGSAARRRPRQLAGRLAGHRGGRRGGPHRHPAPTSHRGGSRRRRSPAARARPGPR